MNRRKGGTLIALEEPKTIEDFAAIKAGDVLAVEWKGQNFKGRRSVSFAIYEVYDNLFEKGANEIVLQKYNNVYFNFAMYLEGKSIVRSVAKIVSKDPA